MKTLLGFFAFALTTSVFAGDFCPAGDLKSFAVLETRVQYVRQQALKANALSKRLEQIGRLKIREQKQAEAQEYFRLAEKKHLAAVKAGLILKRITTNDCYVAYQQVNPQKARIKVSLSSIR